MLFKISFPIILLIMIICLAVYEIRSYHKSQQEKDQELLTYSRNRFRRRMLGIFIILLIAILISAQIFYPSLINSYNEIWGFLIACFVLIVFLGIITFFDIKETLIQLIKKNDEAATKHSEDLKQIILEHINKKRESNNSNEANLSDNKNDNN